MIYTVYKTINIINNKEYIGFHSIKSIDDVKYEKSINGSIFEDGYLGSGKLIKRAIEKYGPMNMRQELLLATENREEAEEFERNLVCREWVESEDNYNLSIGGNVAILFGENNGFYGKKHSEETLEKIVKSREKTRKEVGFSATESYLVSDETVVFYNKIDIGKYFNIDPDNWFEINKLFYEGVVRYRSDYYQEKAVKRYLKRLNFLEDTESREAAKKKVSRLTSERFKGKPLSEESKKKRSETMKAWVKNNPEEHKARMEKINKNPEKIEKTAQKHRGMKRSPETCKNISESLKGKPSKNKGKIIIHNKETLDTMYIDKNSTIPEGWARGTGKKRPRK